jgi:hypothetical protein
MTTVVKYTLQNINDISTDDFTYLIPEETFNMINYLCSQVGSSSLTTNIYQNIANKNSDIGFKTNNKKRKGNKSMEVSADEWESIRSFQATKLDQHSGIDAEIDQIRLLLNKLTDKTFSDIRGKIMDKINKIISESVSEEDLIKVGNILYDTCSSNRFYSSYLAALFSELAKNYEWLMKIFKDNYKDIMNQYNNIKYIDSDVDYDGFCDMNKINEHRRAVTSFLLYLAKSDLIKQSDIVNLLKCLLVMITNLINKPDKKNEVDELTENVAILYKKDIIDEVLDETDDEEDYYVGEQSIIDTVNGLAKMKAKDYPSLSNKAIFKYMDLVEM